MSFLATLLTLLVQALLPALVEASRSTASAASAEVALRERLRRQVRRTWPACARVLLFLLLLRPLGCATRTLYVPDGTPVRLRETVRAVKVWVVDGEGQVIPGVMDLPEGWYALPQPPEEKD